MICEDGGNPLNKRVMVGCSFKNSDITRHLEVGKGRGGGKWHSKIWGGHRCKVAVEATVQGLGWKIVGSRGLSWCPGGDQGFETR